MDRQTIIERLGLYDSDGSHGVGTVCSRFEFDEFVNKVVAFVKRLELEATISEHKELCDDCGWRIAEHDRYPRGAPFIACDRRRELDDKLAKVKG